MKHTPGPWTVTEIDDERRSSNELPVVVTFSTEHLHRRFHATGKELFEEDSANAQLIGALPELLSLCKKLLQICEDEYPEEQWAEYYKPIIEAQELIARLEK